MGPVRNVDDLMAVGHGYQRAMVLFAALKLGVFRGLASGGCDASALARRVGADPGKLSILLDALAVQGLVGKKGKRYRNAQVARELLLPGPRSMESILLHHLDGWGEWGRLSATVRAGRTPVGGADGGYQENFIRGMEENARKRAAAVARKILSAAGTASWTSGAGRAPMPSRGRRRIPARKSPSSTRRGRSGSPGRSFGKRGRRRGSG